MKLIPKPEGFDLRDRRSAKSCSGSDWQPADALYSAQQRILSAKADTVMIIWREIDEQGEPCTCFSFSGQPVDGPALFLNAIGKFMGWFKQ